MANQPRTWVEISATALKQNFNAFQKVIGPPVKIAPIIKANAYGHDFRLVAKTLAKQPIWGFGVAYGQEADDLWAIYKGKILILTNWQAKELNSVLRHKNHVVAWDRESLSQIIDQAKKLKIRPRVHLKLDTGTTRIGFTKRDRDWLKYTCDKNRDSIVGLFSHLSQSEDKLTAITDEQINEFNDWISFINHNRAVKHLACSAAALRYPRGRYDLVRVGIGLYGIWPSSETKKWAKTHRPEFSLKPVMTWKSKLSQVKIVPAGTGVGYGRTFITKRPSRIGIIPVGYSDGYDRGLSNKSWVMINGRAAPVVGRVSMNLMMVDCTTIKNIRRGQPVTLLGPGIDAETMAKLGGRIAYEPTTAINPLIPRFPV